MFYNGQLWDARVFVERLIGSAKRSLLLIDNWATVETLDLFAKKRTGVKVTDAVALVGVNAQCNVRACSIALGGDIMSWTCG